MFFRQLKRRGDNFSYVIADEDSGTAAVIDPDGNGEQIAKLLQEEGFTLDFIINTHGHRDHTEDNNQLKKSSGGRIVTHELSKSPKDLTVADGDALRVGKVTMRVIHTPGHTTDSICLLADNKLLTGDTLFVGECGRTDLPGSSSVDMYHSLFHKLMKLDDSIEVYPGHDYGPKPFSTIGAERETNYTLERRTLEEFIEFMSQP